MGDHANATVRTKRTKEIHVRFSEVELECLVKLAADEGLDLSNTLRRLVRRAAVRPEPMKPPCIT